MTKFRRNHAQSSRQSSGMIIKVGIFAAILAGLYALFNGNLGDLMGDNTPIEIEEPIPVENEYLLPTSNGEVVHHEYYSLSYIEEHEQAEWVAYALTKESLAVPNVPRRNDWKFDEAVTTGSTTPYDFKHPDYDRGHLAPAADFAFNETAMSETFYMSNISPQQSAFNQGIWRELEELTRDWAWRNGRLFVVTGPVLTQPIKERIGNSRVSVPAAYYKVLLDIDDPERKGIGFIMPNQVSYEPVMKYAVSIDEVEELTGIDFFGSLLEDETEERLESRYDTKRWKTNEQKYRIRKDKWNERARR